MVQKKARIKTRNNEAVYQIDDLVGKIKKLSGEKSLVLIAIDGRGGSGKSTLAAKIKNAFPKAKIIHVDDFHNTELNRIDYERLGKEVLKPLSLKKEAKYRQFNWKIGRLGKTRVIQPEGIVIIEGAYSMHSSIARFYDIKIWIECSLGKANEWAKEREITKKWKHDERWEKYWRPFENRYITTDKPRERADFVGKWLGLKLLPARPN